MLWKLEVWVLCWVLEPSEKHGVCLLCWICACSGCRTCTCNMLTPLLCWLAGCFCAVQCICAACKVESCC